MLICEVGFWLLLGAGLVARYVLRERRPTTLPGPPARRTQGRLMPDRLQALIAKIEDRLEHLAAAIQAADRRELVAAVQDSLYELVKLVSRRRWPPVVRGNLPPGATSAGLRGCAQSK